MNQDKNILIKRVVFYPLIIAFFFLLFTDCKYSRRRISDETKSNTTQLSNRKRNSTNTNNNRKSHKSVVKMNHQNGVYFVPCKINGVEMDFVFDTGASDVTMSLTEAIFLYKQGKLTDDDITGSQQYQIADGSIHEGTTIILRSVEIGGRKLNNIDASIVSNMDAPLLLGQSALSKFGKISIDYTKNEIIFE